MEKQRKASTENRIFVRHRIVSAVKTADFYCDKIAYIVLRIRWCNINVFNAHAPSEEKSNDSKETLYEKLEYVFVHFSECHRRF
jgi:hypothetical protein